MRMPTANPRLNITFKPTTAALLSRMARREKKSVASLTKELVLDALERREDMELSMLAIRREKENKGKKTISHEDAWK
jgi:hypothetical protein